MMGRQFNPQTQRGAVLVVALVFLVVLTVAGVTAMRFATMEERMASNMQFRNQTFQIAQSELRYQLLAINTNKANRAPLQVAMSNPLEPQDPTNLILKILPDTTRTPKDLTVKMQNHLKVSQVRMTLPEGSYCSDSANQGSTMNTGKGFTCSEFELSALAALDDSCAPDYQCGANSSQAIGISFINNN